MNVYDKANELADAIRQSDEFRRYKQSAEVIDKNPTHQKMIKDFMDFQYRMYMHQAMGEEPSEEDMNAYTTLYSTIANVENIKNFMEAQMYFARLMEDINKTIADATDTGVEFLNDLISTDDSEEE